VRGRGQREQRARVLGFGSRALSITLLSACGSTLLLTKLTYSDRDLPRLARGGAALGCHTRESEVFPLFFVCPGQHQALGIAAFDGKLSISCPELRPRLCRKLFERVRSTSWKTRAAAPTPDAGTAVTSNVSDAGADAEL
jgi:hypothetical protein